MTPLKQADFVHHVLTRVNCAIRMFVFRRHDQKRETARVEHSLNTLLCTVPGSWLPIELLVLKTKSVCQEARKDPPLFRSPMANKDAAAAPLLWSQNRFRLRNCQLLLLKSGDQPLKHSFGLSNTCRETLLFLLWIHVGILRAIPNLVVLMLTILWRAGPENLKNRCPYGRLGGAVLGTAKSDALAPEIRDLLDSPR